MSETVAVIDARPKTSAFRPRFAAPSQIAPADNADLRSGGMSSDEYSRGFADGQAAANTLIEEQKQQFSLLLNAAQILQPEPSEEIACMISETVSTLVMQIVGSAPVDAAWLTAKIAEACALIGETEAAGQLVLNPADAALVDPETLRLSILADPEMPRGSLRIEHSSGWIEHGRAHRLDALKALLASAGDAA